MEQAIRQWADSGQDPSCCLKDLGGTDGMTARGAIGFIADELWRDEQSRRDESRRQRYLELLKHLAPSNSGEFGYAAFRAAWARDLECLQLFHKWRVPLIRLSDEFGTCLVAARSGALDVLHFLHDIGCDCRAKDNNGNTPAHLAAGSGALDVLLYLHDIGCDFLAKNEFGEVPFDLLPPRAIERAVSDGNHAALRLFLDCGMGAKKWQACEDQLGVRTFLYNH
eukprot:4468896-Amphidinium_carterae.1